MTKLTLSLESRQLSGKAVKKLRQQGLLPANIYGKDTVAVPVQVRVNAFRPILSQAGETQIVYVRVGQEKDDRPVLISGVQYDPVTDQILHVDFRQVNLKEKITANVPVELVGESPAVRDLAASLIINLSEIRVEALPSDLPESFKLDVALLQNIGDVLKVSDLAVDHQKVKVQDTSEAIIVTVVEQQKEEVAPPSPIVPTPETAPVVPEAPKPEAA